MSQEKGARLTRAELDQVWPVETQVIDTDGYVWEFDGSVWINIEADPEEADPEEADLATLALVGMVWGPLYWPPVDWRA